MRGLWLRWTWRDLRARWVQVLATALVIAVGIGAFAGLGGLREWRERSADESLAALRAHDLRVDLADGAYVRAGRLRAVLQRLPAGTIEAAEERLVAASQIDASRPGRPVLVPARLIGVPVRRGGQAVDALALKAGRGLEPRAARAAVLDWNFAHYYDLPAEGRIRLAGLGEVPYTGLGVSPQYLIIVGEAGLLGAESGLAVVYLPLEAVQQTADRAGEVNQLLVRAAPGGDLGRVERAVRGALAASLPGVGVSVARADQEPVADFLYRDARNDQRTLTAFAILLLAGAALAAFNLVSRVVEAQRREIGIGMALGAEPRTLALRPLALGVQIGVLGAVLGVPVGIGLAELFKGVLRDFLPLPVFASTFPTGRYLAGALIGAAIPVLAAALPVRRAIRVQPVEAIRTGYRAAKGIAAAALLRRAPIPGRPLVQLPLRNLARTPRRTIMTVLGLGAVITTVVGILGVFDSVSDVADRQEAELLSSNPSRLDVGLSTLVRAKGLEVGHIARTPGVQAAEPGLTVGASVRAGGTDIPIVLTFVDPCSRIWHPSATNGSAPGEGVLLARKAAEDLGVSVGDTVVLRHPRRAGASMALADTRVRVTGIHGNPVRVFAYMGKGRAAALGLGGLANTVAVVPRPGTTSGALERALFGRPGIASVRPAAAEVDALRSALDEFRSVIRAIALVTLGLALLVAFTSTSVSVDERRREYATMFAFGLPPRSGLRVATSESLVTGVLGTIVGLVLGLGVAGWIVNAVFADTYPDLGLRTVLSVGSIGTTVIVGIVAVALAPLLTYPRLRRMDIPSTLRVME